MARDPWGFTSAGGLGPVPRCCITETVIYHPSKLTQQEPSGPASRRRAAAALPDRMTTRASGWVRKRRSRARERSCNPGATAASASRAPSSGGDATASLPPSWTELKVLGTMAQILNSLSARQIAGLDPSPASVRFRRCCSPGRSVGNRSVIDPDDDSGAGVARGAAGKQAGAAATLAQFLDQLCDRPQAGGALRVAF